MSEPTDASAMEWWGERAREFAASPAANDPPHLLRCDEENPVTCPACAAKVARDRGDGEAQR